MGNLFDALQSNLFNTCTVTFGYMADWHSSISAKISAPVLFGEPSRKVKLNDVDYMPPSYHMEYMAGIFNELKNLVDNGSAEVVEINTIKFNVTQVFTKYDGNTFVAVLTPVL